MKQQERYSRSAVVVSTIAWLALAALFGGIAAAEYLLDLSLPQWLLWSLVIAAVISVVIGTIVSSDTRCKLTEWFPLFW